MSGKMTRDAYVRLIEENIAWLKSVDNTRGSSLEMRHIVDVLLHSVDMYYDVLPAAKRLVDFAQYRHQGRVINDYADEIHTMLKQYYAMQGESGIAFQKNNWRPRGVVNHGWPQHTTRKEVR